MIYLNFKGQSRIMQNQNISNMRKLLILLIFAISSTSLLMAQGKPLGKVTAVTKDKRHSVSGTLIQYTDAYSKPYLELEIGADKPMVVKELKYAPYDYQYYAYLGSRDIDMPILNESAYYYFNFKIPLENPGRFVSQVRALSEDGKKYRSFRIYQYNSPLDGIYYEAEHGPGNRRAPVNKTSNNSRFKYYIQFYDAGRYFYNLPQKTTRK